MIEIFTAIFSNALFSFVVPGIVIGLISIIVGFLLDSVLNKYKIVLILAGFLVVLFFTFQAGRHIEVVKYENQVNIQKAIISDLKVEAAKIETKIVTEYIEKIKFVDKIKEVKTNVYVTQKDDSACVISAGASADIARLLNSASRGELPEPPRAFDGQTQ